MAKKEAAGTVKVTQTGSPIRRKKDQLATLKGLGLGKMHRTVELKDTPRGAIKYDHLGNVVGDFFIRHLEKQNGKLVNKTVKTYHNVSQFWTYDEKKFLSAPVYSRNYPPVKS